MCCSFFLLFVGCRLLFDVTCCLSCVGWCSLVVVCCLSHLCVDCRVLVVVVCCGSLCVVGCVLFCVVVYRVAVRCVLFAGC